VPERTLRLPEGASPELLIHLLASTLGEACRRLGLNMDVVSVGRTSLAVRDPCDHLRLYKREVLEFLHERDAYLSLLIVWIYYPENLT
jgi:hypothetical protein